LLTYIKLPERNAVLMVHSSINKKYGSYIKYSKFGASILTIIRAVSDALSTGLDLSHERL
jgi:hypothetical protein